MTPTMKAIATVTVTVERNDSHPDGESVRILGTWEWVQLTYSDLRIAPDGECIATFHEGYWTLVDGSTWSDVIVGTDSH